VSRPPETIIVDGYNLLLRGFRHYEGGDLEAARARLEVRLREFLRVMGPSIRLIVFYDGTRDLPPRYLPPTVPPRGRGRKGDDPSFEVVFTAAPRTADEAIIEECRRLEGSGPITVITSDVKDIGRKVSGRVRVRSSEDFADLLDASMLSRPDRAAGRAPAAGQAPAPAAAAPGEKPEPGEESPSEVDEWVRIFSRPKEPPGRRKGRGK